MTLSAPSVYWLLDARRVDGVNIALIILTCVLAHMFPYHLLFLSYAVLGPAHYLTQISWMHDRKYFVRARGLVPIFLVLTFLLMLSANLTVWAVLLTTAVAAAVAFVCSDRFVVIVPSVLGGAALGYVVAEHISPLAVFIALLLPTVLHVFVFTVGFMWSGAIKTHSRSAYAVLGALLVGVLTFLIPGSTCGGIPPEVAQFFQPVVNYMQAALPVRVSEAQLFGFLSFVYTYHYLNWFSKAEVIHWNRIPPRRLWGIIAVYLLALGEYAHDYTTGFVLILFLSVMHVLLELPLNLRTFGAIAVAVVPRAMSKNKVP